MFNCINKKLIFLSFCIGLVFCTKSMEQKSLTPTTSTSLFNSSFEEMLFEDINEAILLDHEIPTLVEKKIAQAYATNCFKDLLELKKRKEIAGTPHEQKINHAIVELMGGIYHPKSLVETSLEKIADSFDQLPWTEIKKILEDTRLIADLRIALVNHPIKPSLDTLLYRYTERGQLESVNTLLALGADPNIPNFVGSQPLDIAYCKGNNELIKVLQPITRNPSPKPIPIKYGLFDEGSLQYFFKKEIAGTLDVSTLNTVVEQALKCGNNQIIPIIAQQFMRRGMTHSVIKTLAQSSRLHHCEEIDKKDLFKAALLAGNIALVKQMILDGFDVHQENYRECILHGEGSMYHLMPVEKMIALMELLTRAGVPLDYIDQAGCVHTLAQEDGSILHYLCEEGMHGPVFGSTKEKNYIDLALWLKDQGYDFDLMVTGPNLTPLEFAIQRRNYSLINFIIELAQKKQIAIKELINLQKFSRWYSQFDSINNNYDFLIQTFINLIGSNLTPTQKFNCIRELSTLSLKRSPSESFTARSNHSEIAPPSEEAESIKEYDIFLKLFENQNELNLVRPELLNYGLLYKYPKLIQQIIIAAKNQGIRLETLFNRDNLKNLFTQTNHRPSENVQLNRIHDILKIIETILSPEEVNALLGISLDEENHTMLHLIILDKEWSFYIRNILIRNLVAYCPLLKTQKDLQGNTPLDLIKQDPELANNQELIALFDEHQENLSK